MKKNIYSLIIFLSIIILSSCCDHTYDESIETTQKHLIIKQEVSGNLYKTIDFAFDSEGRVISETVDSNIYTFEYNNQNKLTNVYKNATENVLAIEWNGNIATRVISNGNILKYYYNNKGLLEVLSVVAGQSEIVEQKYEYDENDNLTAIYSQNDELKESFDSYNITIENPLSLLKGIELFYKPYPNTSKNIVLSSTEMPWTEYNESDNEIVYHQLMNHTYNWEIVNGKALSLTDTKILGLKQTFEIVYKK